MTYSDEEGPDVSLVLPCYNEEASIEQNARDLLRTFSRQNIRLELVLVDNGSADRTGAIIDSLVDEGLRVVKVRVPVNHGYGLGVIEGLRNCSAPFIGYLCADAQVSADDTVRIYRLVQNSDGSVIGKVRRRFRKDSWRRRLTSIAYNGVMWLLFGQLRALDLNGTPKILSRDAFRRMRLSSKDWFLDPELMIKARVLGLNIKELNVPALPRRGGKSRVRVSTIGEFLKNIVRYRFGPELSEWKKALPPPPKPAPPPEPQPMVMAADRFNRVRIFEQKRFVDTRGYLQKVLAASQCDGSPPRGEVYISAAIPGEAKGNHMHHKMGEWFAVVQGEASMEVFDPETGARRSIPFRTPHPRTIYIPPGLAHAVVNRGKDLVICVAWAEREHDPEDVYTCQVWPPE